jgi:hypothetical protein
MYLWKYWRETRIIFGTSVVSIAIMFVVNLWSQNVDPLQSFDQLLTIIPTALALQAFPISFIAWLLGSFGVGRDLGERSGSYLFSRPRSRGFFVWHDWGLGNGTTATDSDTAKSGPWVSDAPASRVSRKPFSRQHSSLRHARRAHFRRLLELWRHVPSGRARVQPHLLFYGRCETREGSHPWHGQSVGVYGFCASSETLLGRNTSAQSDSPALPAIYISSPDCYWLRRSPGLFHCWPCLYHPAFSSSRAIRPTEDGHYRLRTPLPFGRSAQQAPEKSRFRYVWSAASSQAKSENSR